MLKVYCCPECRKIAYLTINMAVCKRCGLEYEYLDISYKRFVDLNKDEREVVIDNLLKENQIIGKRAAL